MLEFLLMIMYTNMRCLIYPGVAKFGIALGSGPRGRGFKSRHSDHQAEPGRVFAFQAQFFILSFHSRFQWVSFFVNVSQKSTVHKGSYS